MLQAIVSDHLPRMLPCRITQTFFHAQRQRASEFAALVREFQQIALGVEVLG